MLPDERLLPLKHTERKNACLYLLALACTAFHREDCPVVRPFGGMGDLESRRPSSGGGLFTFDLAERTLFILPSWLRKVSTTMNIILVPPQSWQQEAIARALVDIARSHNVSHSTISRLGAVFTA
jgi:hypothetical protein